MKCLTCLLDVTDDAGAVSRQMANWLKNASTVSAPNPYQRQIFGGGKSKGVGSVIWTKLMLKETVLYIFILYNRSVLIYCCHSSLVEHKTTTFVWCVFWQDL